MFLLWENKRLHTLSPYLQKCKKNHTVWVHVIGLVFLCVVTVHFHQSASYYKIMNVLLCSIFFIYPKENAYKLCFSSLWESSKKFQLNSEMCKRSCNSQKWSHVHKHSRGMCIHNWSWVICNISVGQPLLQVIIWFLDLK